MFERRPNLSRGLLHLSFWCCWALFYFPVAPKGWVSVGFNLISMVPATYLAIALLLRLLDEGDIRKIWGRAFLVWIGAGLMYASVDILMDYLVFDYLPEGFGKSMYGYAFSFFFVISFPICIELFMYVVRSNIRAQKLQEQRHEADLALLKSQINPHFLFNTLNSIYSLSMTKPDKVAPVVLGLSNLMRYMLTDSQKNHVTLGTELDYITNYIALEKLRLDAPESLRVSIDRTHDDALIAPMLLLPLVENVFKHGDLSAPAVVEISIHNQSLHYHSENRKLPSPPLGSDKPSMGLENLQKRLGYLYPRRHHFNISGDGDVFSVTLELSLS